MSPTYRVTHVIAGLTHGGTEKLVLQLAQLQSSLGHHVAVAYINSVFTNHGDEQFEQEFKNRFQAFDVKTYALEENPSRFYWLTRLRNFKRLLHTEAPDVIHVHLGRGLMLMLLSRCKVPATMTLHSVNIGFPRILFRLFRRLNVRYAAVSTSVAKNFETEIESSIEIIPNGIDYEKFRTRQIPHQQLNGECTFVAVGRVLPPKNYPMLIDAAKKLSENSVSETHPWKLVIAGDGPLLSEMRLKVTEQGLQERVTFLGGCSDIPEFLESADVFVMSSDYEGMPIAMLEAMSVGLPVVCTNFLGVNEVVQAEQSALVSEVGDAESLASNMARLLISHSMREQLSLECVKASKHFSIQSTNEQYLTMYQRTFENQQS